jgi:hypothetical protein
LRYFGKKKKSNKEEKKKELGMESHQSPSGVSCIKDLMEFHIGKENIYY